MIQENMINQARNADMLTFLIQHVTVSDRVKVGNKRTQEIKIHYRFIGNLSPKKEK